MEEPTDVDELQRVVGIFSYVADAIPRFAHRVAPLRALLVRCCRADAGRKRLHRPSRHFFPMTGPERRAFRDLKQTMQDPAFLAPFDPDKEAI